MQAVLPMPLLTKEMQRVIFEDQMKMSKKIKKDFEKSVRTWDHRPKMQVRVKYPIKVMRGNAMLTINIGPDPFDPDTKIFTFVDLGTRPHEIRAKNAPALVFQWGGPGSYKAKTKPRNLNATTGGPTGPIVAFEKVNHPGTEARLISETVARHWGQLSRKYAPKTMERVVEASGHSMRGR
jgi:hypothetical protein